MFSPFDFFFFFFFFFILEGRRCHVFMMNVHYLHIPIPPGILLDMQNARCIEGGIYPYTLFFSHDSVLGLFMHGF